jgi:amidase
MTPLDPFTSAVDLAAAIRRKEVSPAEAADGYLARMDALDPKLNAFCHRADGQVRAAAAAATGTVLRSAPEDLPPFHGVPLPIKDLVDVAGWPTTYGSAGASPAPVPASSPVVHRFADAGFVLFGKTTTSEFGSLPFTENEAMGITRNPWDYDRTPGGSSSGAGAAVASAMVPIAHGEDGGGSIRVPASCTGLVGLKTTRGLVTLGTVLLEGFGTSGVLTRTVTDTAAVLDVLARHDPGEWWSPPTPERSFAAEVTTDPPAHLRIGVLDASPLAGVSVDPACAAAVRATLKALEAAGHHIVDAPLPLPPAEELIAALLTIWNVSSAGIPLADTGRVEPRNAALRAAARSVSSWTYAEAVLDLQRLSRRIVEAFVGAYDVLVTPTMACLPPLVGSLQAGPGEDPVLTLLNSYPMNVFTSLFNITGQPAISVPVHHDEATGLPVGVQLVAAPWREDLLLQVARSLELALPWAGRRPPAS